MSYVKKKLSKKQISRKNDVQGWRKSKEWLWGVEKEEIHDTEWKIDTVLMRPKRNDYL